MKVTKPIQSRMDVDNYNKLIEHSNKKGLSLSMLIRLIIIEYLENNNG